MKSIARKPTKSTKTAPAPTTTQPAVDTAQGRIAPAKELDPSTIALRIACALNHLELLDWALSAKLEGDDYEVFTNPLQEAWKDLEALRAELYASRS